MSNNRRALRILDGDTQTRPVDWLQFEIEETISWLKQHGWKGGERVRCDPDQHDGDREIVIWRLDPPLGFDADGVLHQHNGHADVWRKWPEYAQRLMDQDEANVCIGILWDMCGVRPKE